MTIEMEFPSEGGVKQEFDIPIIKWSENVPNEVEIVKAPAVAGPGQIGPHKLGLGVSYVIQVYKDLGPNVLERVDLEVLINITTGLITLRISPLAPDFNGRVIIESIA